MGYVRAPDAGTEGHRKTSTPRRRSAPARPHPDAGTTGHRPAPRKRYIPRTDVQMSGPDYGEHRVRQFKKTAAYRKAMGAASTAHARLALEHDHSGANVQRVLGELLQDRHDFGHDAVDLDGVVHSILHGHDESVGHTVSDIAHGASAALQSAGRLRNTLSHSATQAGGKVAKAADRSIEHNQGASVTSEMGPGNDVGKIPYRAAKGVAVATYKHPGEVAGHTVTGGVNTLKGTLAGVVALPVETVSESIHGHPLKPIKELARQVADDYSRRYGPLLHPGGQKEFEDRIVKEGAFAEALDTLGAGAISGKTLGRAAVGAAKARGGRVGEFVTKPRPGLKKTESIVKEQPLAPNIGRIAAQRVIDHARQQSAETGLLPVKGGAAHHAPRGTLHYLQPGPDEVIPITARARHRATKMAAAATKSKAVQNFKAALHEHVTKGAYKEIYRALPRSAKLGKDHYTAFVLAARGEVPILNHEGVRTYVERRINEIKEHRLSSGQPAAHEFDNVADLERLLKPGVIEKVFTPKLQTLVQGLHARDLAAAERDPTLTSQQAALRRVVNQAHSLGYERGIRAERGAGGVPHMVHFDESPAAFIQRIENAAVEVGLERPVYFPSDKHGDFDFAARAVGGAKYPAKSRAYTGELFRSGRENLHPEVYVTGLTRTLKHAHTARLVVKQFDQQVPVWGHNKTLAELREALAERGLDPKQWAYWNHGLFLEHHDRLESAAHNEAIHHAQTGDVDLAQAVENGVPENALRHAAFPGDPGHGVKQTGWSLVPKVAYDEILTTTRPSGKAGRAFDIAKSKATRLILGTSLPWLQFQVLSNTTLTTLATSGRALMPHSVVQMKRWWDGLDTEARETISSEAGIGAGMSHEARGPHGGSVFNGRMVAYWRALRSNPFWVMAAKGNPIELMMKADMHQNDFFRKLVLHDRIKQQAIDDMGGRMHTLFRDQDQINEHIAKLSVDAPTIVRHADSVNQLLGDFLNFTYAERRGLARMTMFYGFLRYSLKLLFYTLPVNHPLTTAVVGTLGRLHADEIKALVGDPPGGDETNLPFGLGTLRFGKDGQLSVDLSRANPALSAVTQADHPGQMLSSLAPPLAWAIEQGTGQSLFTGESMNIQGHHSTEHNAPRLGGLLDPTRAAVLGADVARLVAPYRAVEHVISPASVDQADSVLGIHNRPYAPTSASARARQKIKLAEIDKEGPSWLQIIRQSIEPLIPKEDSARAKAKRSRDFKHRGSRQPNQWGLGPSHTDEWGQSGNPTGSSSSGLSLGP